MRVLKVVAEGLTTSFRYPHFMQQVHPSFPMPPPATIYGHIASALGEWFQPEGVQVAYQFTHRGEVSDKEHIILLTPSTGKLPGTQLPKVLEGNVNPFERSMFFQPRLVLYVNRPEWEPAFRSPHYAVALGRSQDLFTYVSVETVELQPAPAAYFEHTLVPYEMALQVGRGTVILMPRYLDHDHNRRPAFGRYLVIDGRVKLPRDDGPAFGQEQPFWVDPDTEEWNGLHLGLAFLNFTGEPYATLA